MFFSDKIASITDKCRVLEVGPGGSPHPRADILLEKLFEEEKETIAQRGYAPESKTNKKIIYYDGGIFPFIDKEFDYVICTHVLEHVPLEELPIFIAELQRVAKAGFVEFPTIFYELINHQNVHLWYMNYRDDTVLFLDKNVFVSNYVHKILREMFYGSDKYMSKTFDRYRDLFFSHFEWSGSFTYKVVGNYDELINEEDYIKHKNYFANFKKGKHLDFSMKVFLKKILNKVTTKLKFTA